MIDLRHGGDQPLGGAPVEGHFGLLLDKLAAVWAETEGGGREIDKTETLCRLMGRDKDKPAEYRPKRNRTLGTREQVLLKAQHHRLDAMVATRGRAATYKTLGPLAIGMGNSSPLENGLTTHPTYGVPYIPGSAIKGMLAAWCQDWLNPVPSNFEQLFGRAAGASDAKRIGGVTFLDTLPCAPVTIMVDVMTPHAGPYYSDPPLPPADWHSPVPISFIAVPEGQPFRLRFLVNGRAGFLAEQAFLDGIQHLLDEALLTIGIGAKTAAGYGRLARAT